MPQKIPHAGQMPLKSEKNHPLFIKLECFVMHQALSIRILGVLLLLISAVGCGSRSTTVLQPDLTELEAFELEQARAREEAAAVFAADPNS